MSTRVTSPRECRLAVAAERGPLTFFFGAVTWWQARVWVDGMPSATVIIVSVGGRPPYVWKYRPLLYMGFIPRNNDVHTDATRLGISVGEFRLEILRLWTASASDLDLRHPTVRP